MENDLVVSNVEIDTRGDCRDETMLGLSNDVEVVGDNRVAGERSVRLLNERVKDEDDDGARAIVDDNINIGCETGRRIVEKALRWVLS